MSRVFLEADVRRAQAMERKLRTGDGRTAEQIQNTADYIARLKAEGALVWDEADWIAHAERMAELRESREKKPVERSKTEGRIIKILSASLDSLVERGYDIMYYVALAALVSCGLIFLSAAILLFKFALFY